MDITPLKQKYYHSCLVTSLLMIARMTDQSIEERIFFEGEKRIMEYYLNSILASFVDNTKLSVEVIVDNKFFANELTKTLKKRQKSIMISHQKITTELIAKLIKTDPVVLHLDNNYLGDFSHDSHFVVVEKQIANEKFEIIDPASGSTRILTKENLDEAVQSLKNYIKMCPLIIRKI